MSARGNNRLIVPYPGECRQAPFMHGGAALSPPHAPVPTARDTVLRAIDRAREMRAGFARCDPACGLPECRKHDFAAQVNRRRDLAAAQG
jgi:hypothetical protein